MRKIAHIINLVGFPLQSDLKIAQQITLETVKIAKVFSTNDVDVNLLSAQYPEDRRVVPESFIATKDLDRSVLDVGSFNIKRKLPLVKDILDRAYETCESDYIIFTNVDIALLPNFYVSVSNLIDSGLDSFIINRRTISKAHTSVKDIPLMYAEAGRPHMGYDCFVFRRDAYKKFSLGLICVGAPYIGKAILVNQMLSSNNFQVLYDQHLTFHIGNDKPWTSKNLRDYEIHNQSEFNKILASLELREQRLARKALSMSRWKGLKNKLGNFVGLD